MSGLRFRGADQGSTIPLVLGLFIIALLLVAGSVAAGDAFVQQSGLQDECDGAAIAAASSADLNGSRTGTGSAEFLQLTRVQQAVQTYLARSETGVQARASLSPDRVSVTLECAVTRPVAFGAWFGLGGGVTHHATASAKAPLRLG